MIGWFLLLAAALGILTERFLGISVRFQFPPCLFHLATGYYCPGCGGTRAVSALLHGQLLRSFVFHPVVPYGAALFLRALFGTSLELLTKGRLAWGYELKKKGNLLRPVFDDSSFSAHQRMQMVSGAGSFQRDIENPLFPCKNKEQGIF